MTLLDLPWSLSSGSDPSILGSGYKARAAPRSPEPHIHRHTHALTPIRCRSVTVALKFISAVTSGLVKFNHSCWTCPEEIVRHVEGRDIPAKPSVSATVVSLLIKGFLWGFETVPAVLRGER